MGQSLHILLQFFFLLLFIFDKHLLLLRLVLWRLLLRLLLTIHIFVYFLDIPVLLLLLLLPHLGHFLRLSLLVFLGLGRLLCFLHGLYLPLLPFFFLLYYLLD